MADSLSEYFSIGDDVLVVAGLLLIFAGQWLLGIVAIIAGVIWKYMGGEIPESWVAFLKGGGASHAQAPDHSENRAKTNPGFSDNGDLDESPITMSDVKRRRRAPVYEAE